PLQLPPSAPRSPHTTLFRSAVAGEDRNAVAIFMIVRQGQRFLVILGAHDRENRAKDFFLVDAHVLGHMVEQAAAHVEAVFIALQDRKSTRLNSSHVKISYAV